MAETCMICNTMRDILTKNHLRQHNITMEEYRALYGTSNKKNPISLFFNGKKALQKHRTDDDIRVWGKKQKPAWIEHSAG